MSLPKNHVSIILADDVLQVCQPLFSATDITGFFYSKLYHDGRLAVLVTDPYYHQHFWERRYNETSFSNYKEGSFYNNPWDTALLCEAREVFKKDHFFINVKQYPDHLEVAGFNSDPYKNSVLNTYVNHQDLLEKFILYFKENAKDLIIKSDQNQLITPNYSFVPEDLSQTDPNIEALETILDIKKFEFHFEGKTYQMSKKQMQALKLFSQGYTNKLMAKELNLTPRGSESRILGIREKLGMPSKEALVKACAENNLADLLL